MGCVDGGGDVHWTPSDETSQDVSALGESRSCVPLRPVYVRDLGSYVMPLQLAVESTALSASSRVCTRIRGVQ